MSVAATSIAAFRSTPIAGIRDQVYDVIESFGATGCITDDVIGHFGKTSRTNTGRYTGRFSELVKDGRVVRIGDTRPGVSGKAQQVMRAAVHALGMAPIRPARVAKQTGFYAGMKFATLLIRRHVDITAATPALIIELRKAASR